MKVLVKVSLDFADEFQCEEFKVFQTIYDYHNWFTRARAKINSDYYREFYFGTNEFHEFEDFDCFSQCITIHYITDEEALVFDRYFDNKSFGTSGLFNV